MEYSAGGQLARTHTELSPGSIINIGRALSPSRLSLFFYHRYCWQNETRAHTIHTLALLCLWMNLANASRRPVIARKGGHFDWTSSKYANNVCFPCSTFFFARACLGGESFCYIPKKNCRLINSSFRKSRKLPQTQTP